MKNKFYRFKIEYNRKHPMQAVLKSLHKVRIFQTKSTYVLSERK